MLKRQNANTAVLLAALVCAAVAVCSFQNIFNVDFWYHLAAGRWMTGHHAFTYTDPFSFTAAGTRWLNYEWLFQLVLYAVYSIGAIPAVVLFRGALLAVSAIGVFRLFPDKWPQGIRAALTLGVFAFVLNSRNMVRPELVSLALLPYFLSYYFRILSDGDFSLRTHRRTIALYCALMILWVNCHGGFWLILSLTPIAAIAWFQQKPYWREGVIRNPFILLGVVFGLLTMATPYGWQMPAGTLKLLNLMTLDDGRGIGELLPTTLSGHAVFWSALAAAWLLCFIKTWRRKHADFMDWGMLCYATWFGGLFERNVPYAAMLFIPSAAKLAADLYEGEIKEKTAAIINGAAAVLCAGLIIFGAGRAAFSLAADRYPVKAAEFIITHLPPTRGYNDQNLGSYLIWAFHGTRPVFLDSRMQQVAGYADLIIKVGRTKDFAPYSLAEWNNLLSAYQADWCLMEAPKHRVFFNGRPVSLFYYFFPQNSWALVYRDGMTALYVRRTPAMANVIKKYELQGVYPDTDNAAAPVTLPWAALFAARGG